MESPIPKPVYYIPALVSGSPSLAPFTDAIRDRVYKYRGAMYQIKAEKGNIEAFADIHLYLGLHYDNTQKGWYYREWAPNARALYLTGDFNWWNPEDHPLKLNNQHIWEIFLPDSIYASGFCHLSKFKVIVHGNTNITHRIPALANYVVQDDETKDFSAALWHPPVPYKWQHTAPTHTNPSLIYEAHVGMAQEAEKVNTYNDFTKYTLPKIKEAGYNTVQLMAVQEHPYYGSYGYHVANFFAPSSRFGTPDDLKALIDTAHGLGLKVIMDCIHSHAVKNVMEGLKDFDGTDHQYFLPLPDGYHELWDSMLFNYGKREVQQFLLSNLRYWLEEFQFDGFRFDGITSMLYHHHGINKDFGSMQDYFSEDVNQDALLYLQLANTLVHAIKTHAVTIAEDVSGMPGLGFNCNEGGIGFDYRLGMGLPDYWVKLVTNTPDEDWDIGNMWGTMLNRRPDEKTIAYVESHDQALVGDQTLAFRLIGTEMYNNMAVDADSMVVDRGIALLNMIRLITISAGGEGYLNFIGNEFGHPDWIDFPREGNNWSYRYARRQWSLNQASYLKYHYLSNFDKAMLYLANKYNICTGNATLIVANHKDQVLAYQKAGLIFIFNFSPTNSYPSFGLLLGTSAKYKEALSTQHAAFGGHNLIDPETEYFTSEDGQLKVYIPARSALVLYNADAY